MNSSFTKYSLQDINKDLNEMLKEDNINVFKVFALKDESKLSVTLSPLPEFKDQYHGLHPRFDEGKLKEFLSSEPINEPAMFWDKVSKLQSEAQYESKIKYGCDFKYFNIISQDIEADEKERKIIDIDHQLESILFGRSILRMASHFGYEIYCSDEKTINDFCNKVISICDSLGYEHKMFISTSDEGKNYVNLMNIWPSCLIDKITLEYDLLLGEKGELKLEPNNSQINKENNLLRQVLCHKKMNYFKLLNDAVYYSGVMPQVMEIECNDGLSANSNIKYLTFKVARTTYATVDMMSNPSTINHPFFMADKEKRDLMIKFDHYEDYVQAKFLHKNTFNTQSANSLIDAEKDEINKLNNYLRHSMNTHTIAVSTNLITADNYLIAAKRSNKSIDSNVYYCSANGQSEFMDKDVSFYKESVFEDLPSMDYHSEYRVDLNNEIRREVIAELGITSVNPEWNYYGASYLCKNNFVGKAYEAITIEDSGSVKERRMHFNVLSSNKTTLNFEDVVKSQKHATENFENANLIGLKTIVDKNIKEMFLRIFKLTYSWIEKNKSRVFLLLFFANYLLLKGNLNEMDPQNIVEVLLLLIYLILTVYEIIKSRKIKRIQRKKRIYLPKYKADSIPNMIKILNKVSKSKSETIHNYHGIFLIMYIMYFMEQEYK